MKVGDENGAGGCMEVLKPAAVIVVLVMLFLLGRKK